MEVQLVTGDLLFGSKVESMIREAGCTPVGGGASAADITVLDLTEQGIDVAAVVGQARIGSEPVLAYYAHTDDDVRRAAIEAGVEKIVPRSRMMREGAELIRGLLPGQ